jgi:hypothetical protein
VVESTGNISTIKVNDKGVQLTLKNTAETRTNLEERLSGSNMQRLIVKVLEEKRKVVMKNSVAVTVDVKKDIVMKKENLGKNLEENSLRNLGTGKHVENGREIFEEMSTGRCVREELEKNNAVTSPRRSAFEEKLRMFERKKTPVRRKKSMEEKMTPKKKEKSSNLENLKSQEIFRLPISFPICIISRFDRVFLKKAFLS